MERRFHLSLGQTVVLYFACGLLAAGSALFIFSYPPPDQNLGGLAFALRTILPFATLAIGVVLWLQTGNRLKKGIADALWPRDEVVSFRSSFDSTPWRTSVGVMIVSSCIVMLTAPHHRDAGWFLLILGQTMLYLQSSFHQTAV